MFNTICLLNFVRALTSYGFTEKMKTCDMKAVVGIFEILFCQLSILH